MLKMVMCLFLARSSRTVFAKSKKMVAWCKENITVEGKYTLIKVIPNELHIQKKSTLEFKLI